MKKILILVSVLTASACTEQKPQTTIAAQEPIYTAALHGWNTWNNPNLLCFTHMPDGLTLRINARQERKWPYYIEQSFITSPKYKVPEKITPHSHAYDGSFIEMDVEFEGMVANIKAGADGDDYLILFTPLGEQERVHALLLQTCYLWNKQGSLLREGQLIRAQDASKTFETVVRATAPSSDLKLPLNTPYLAFESDQTLAFYTGQGERSLEEISEILNAKKKRF
ncbi:MAG: hypothetical protein HC842_06580 [Cytophagales bacterium]|nr:hypothetical protein [Cytophagales bacterium]